MGHSSFQTQKKKNQSALCCYIPSRNLTSDTILKYLIFSLHLPSATKRGLPHLH